jgi:hypothetical protein
MRAWTIGRSRFIVPYRMKFIPHAAKGAVPLERGEYLTADKIVN